MSSSVTELHPDSIETRLDRLETELGLIHALLKTTNKCVSGLSENVRAQFDKVDTQFELVGAHFDKVEAQFNKTYAHLDEVNAKLDRLMKAMKA